MPKKAKKKAKKKTTKKKAAKKKTTKKKASGKKGEGRGKRYSEQQKSKLLDKYHEARSGGMTAQQAARKVGISYLTLLRWEKSLGKAPPKTSRKAAKTGRKNKAGRKKTAGRKPGRKPGRPAGKGDLTLVTPSGYRVEGITTAELIRILQAAK